MTFETGVTYPVTEAIEQAWRGFEGRKWREDVNVREFIQSNYTMYDGDESFLEGPTEATDKLWGRLQELQKEERARGGVLECETEIVSSLTSYGPGYIDESMKELEKIVGLQTDKPLKRAFMPYGGIKMADQAAATYGYEINGDLRKIFTDYHKTHNQAVFDAYTPEMKRARHSHVITGLPDTYGRGRIVGDYRRVALYGLDYLIFVKEKDLFYCGGRNMSDEHIRLREEIAEQIRALKGMKKMAEIYGFDISQPAKNAREAVQWLYFGYLAAIKTQNGAAMSVGRISTFLDIYIQRDLDEGTLTESEAQELIDHLVLKFRMVKFARIPSYNELFSGDPVWVTLEMAGIGMDGRHMVTKNDYRFLHTLENMGPAPEPNLTVLWSSRLPETFKKYATKISINTSSIQYENDCVMRPVWGDDYSICCCVSATQTGKEIQFFGARANLAKCLIYALNGGVDVSSGEQVGPGIAPITSEYLNYDEVMHKFNAMMSWLVELYVNTLNLIHYMHDKYYYEAAEMALIDTYTRRTFATGIAGFSHVVDSLSAIKYAKVKPIRNEQNLIVDYEIEGDFPRYGNDDERADTIAIWLLKAFMKKVREHHTYRNSARTPPTARRRTVCLPLSTPWRSCPTSTPSTASPTPRPSAPTPSATALRKDRTTSGISSTATLTRAPTTSTSTCSASRSSRTAWSTPKSPSTRTSPSAFQATRSSLSTSRASSSSTLSREPSTRLCKNKPQPTRREPRGSASGFCLKLHRTDLRKRLRI